MPDRCTDPTCEEHWPAIGEPVHLTLHTAPPTPTEAKGEAAASWSTLFVDHLLDDGDGDE